MKSRIVLLVTCTLVCLLSRIELNGQAPSPSPTPPPPVDIIYTGKLLGYFRVPSRQAFSQPGGCLARSNENSTAAQEFLNRRDPKAVLLGTGDNFAPQLEARVFSDPPGPPNIYKVGNKELYHGDGNGWIYYLHLNPTSPLAQQIAEGRGTIPTDNVGCFLRAAKFDAIVPGKHDFYFGAERVRQLARFLAKPGTATDPPVQMLGANLILKTTPINPPSIPRDIIDNKWFGKWPDKYPAMNVKDGGSVYPWFSYAKIQLMELRPDQRPFALLLRYFSPKGIMLPGYDLGASADAVKKNLAPVGDNYLLTERNKDLDEMTQLKENFIELHGKTMKLCHSIGGPNNIPTDLSTCASLQKEIRLVGKTIVLYLKLGPRVTGKNGHYSTLVPGKNHGLCADRDCLRFSSHETFFSYPRSVPEDLPEYTDPSPYVVTQNRRVAIFGVVDPALGEQVGVLNFGWKNDQPDLTTRVTAMDPNDALRQQLDYFEAKETTFTGLKVLLAQMNPQRARALAARFSEFQVVVSAADKEQGTSEVKMSTTWDPARHKRAFVAVPVPYFDSSTRKGSIHLGTVRASEDVFGRWVLEARDATAYPISEPDDPATAFWKFIKESPACLPKDFDAETNDNPDNQILLKWLVLCSMRDHTGADLALIQTQDLYEKIPAVVEKLLPQDQLKWLNRADPKDSARVQMFQNIQQTLDRLIWKGDLVTLVYVPGSTLKKVFKQSAAYAAEETATLSLGVDRGRQLEKLGVIEAGGEYLINGLPLVDSKIYSVATTDYMGAGDTGYPDLRNDALNPKTHPGAFNGDLISLSSLVCRKLFSYEEGKPAPLYCLEPLNSDRYLDSSKAKQIPTYEPPGFFKKTWDSLEFEWPAHGVELKKRAAAVEQTVQRREIWRFSLQNFSLGFKSLNNNFTDEEVDDKFDGIPLSGVTAHESQTFNIGMSTRLSRSSHKREFFVGSGIDFQRQSTGDDPTEFDISQAKNRLFGETGLVFWRRPGRAYPNLGLNVSLYTESQLQRPFSVFTLTSKDKLKVTQDRSLLVLPRLGVRWENKSNSFEIGAQAGKELNALGGYVFVTDGVEVQCLANSEVSFKKCIGTNSDPAQGGIITKDSEIRIQYDDRPRAGIYWKTNFSFSLPFTTKVKYEIEQTADFFFVNFARDTSVDTRFRDISKHRLSFIIWPSVSIGPTLDLLLYQNKINRDFLFQRQFGIETKVSFDIFNRRDKGAQLKHKP